MTAPLVSVQQKSAGAERGARITTAFVATFRRAPAQLASMASMARQRQDARARLRERPRTLDQALRTSLEDAAAFSSASACVRPLLSMH